MYPRQFLRRIRPGHDHGQPTQQESSSETHGRTLHDPMPRDKPG